MATRRQQPPGPGFQILQLGARKTIACLSIHPHSVSPRLCKPRHLSRQLRRARGPSPRASASPPGPGRDLRGLWRSLRSRSPTLAAAQLLRLSPLRNPLQRSLKLLTADLILPRPLFQDLARPASPGTRLGALARGGAGQESRPTHWLPTASHIPQDC